MPGRSFRDAAPALTDGEIETRETLRRHVATLAGRIGERNHFVPDRYLSAADHIAETLQRIAAEKPGARFERQTFEAHRRPAVNLILEFPGGAQHDEIVIVGAHYDSVDSCPGADDNASGAAAMLSLATSWAAQASHARTIRFCAFANEEPPYFQTDAMGSYHYARRLEASGDRVFAMISLETMGYFSDTPDSQQYPPPFRWLYPDTGNFIAFVGDLSSRGLVHDALREFRRHATVGSEGAAIPRAVVGVGWSDHWSFWQIGAPAIMVTDTAPFRNPHYHTPEDTPDTLDYDRFSRVVTGLLPVLSKLAR